MKIIMAFLFISTSFARECYEFKFPKNKNGYESILANLSDKPNDHGYILFDTKKGSFSDTFWCMKESDHSSCVGDDDGGELKIYKDYMVIKFLNLGHPDKEMINYQGSNKKLQFMKSKCK